MNNRFSWPLAIIGLALLLPLAQASAQQMDITITSPSAGDVWEVGSTQHIIWTTTNLNDVTIRYSTDNGATWTPIAATVDSTSADWLDLAWQVPDEPSTECMIHIEGYSAGEVPTDSGVFEIKVAAAGNGDGDGDSDESGGFCAAVADGHTAATLALLCGLFFWARRRR